MIFLKKGYCNILHDLVIYNFIHIDVNFINYLPKFNLERLLIFK